ncbi:Hypothetical_protein [Hexamita inflata]|uniref:Hypothetical_protein n=1 Tax=Hexamita inflata TaxID=28002 RepID=A0AA86U1T0_9EUKA|nr:Hypothetical protein HINF_LOCUS24704 [Hexamita inflata]
MHKSNSNSVLQMSLGFYMEPRQKSIKEKLITLQSGRLTKSRKSFDTFSNSKANSLEAFDFNLEETCVQLKQNKSMDLEMRLFNAKQDLLQLKEKVQSLDDITKSHFMRIQNIDEELASAKRWMQVRHKYMCK